MIELIGRQKQKFLKEIGLENPLAQKWISRLKKKYGGTLEDVIAFRDDAKRKLRDLEGGEDRMEEWTFSKHYFYGGWMEKSDIDNRTDTQCKYSQIVERMKK